MARTDPHRPIEERFWEKVDIRAPAECWPWTAAKDLRGYGCFRVGSMSDGTRRQVHASTWVCEQRLGRRFVRGEMACHHCDNPSCCNPTHLYVGNARTNGRDASDRGLLWTVPQLGQDNPNAKLTEAEARAIARSAESLSVLGRRYGVSKTQVSWIKSGKSWGHLSGDHHI